MKLTPLEVRKQSFRKTMRGFDPEEVRIFLDMVAEEYERVLQENGMLSEKVRYLNERLEEYHNLEKTLQNSILTAERVAAESRDRSRLEAETILNDAHIRAERILEDSRNRLRRLGDQVHHLNKQKDLFVQRFQQLLEAQMQFLRSNQEELEVIDNLDTDTRRVGAELARQLGPAEREPATEALNEAVTAPTAEPDPELTGGLTEETPRITRPSVDLPPEPPPGETQPTEAWAHRDTEPAGAGAFFAPAERSEGFFELDAKPTPPGVPPRPNPEEDGQR